MRQVAAVVVGAMDEEVAPYRRRAQSSGEERLLGRARTQLLAVDGRQVLLVRSGIGLVNAGAAAVAALSQVDARALISTGSAGGLRPPAAVGSVVAGDSYTYTGADARAFGYQLGQVPGMPVTYSADAGLLARAATRPTVVVGTVVSGDTFVDAERLAAVHGNFPGAIATDMESTALAQVAHSYGVPFLSVRGISDMCGPTATEDHTLTLDEVSEAAAEVVLAALSP